ncbi:Beta-monoglucosyldiacylglycerol synthase [Corynebacterium occultum]|uniref:Beta-monoglucosyldiacylglycerol synthase n=1 Tax=Corynebacterium occultum TaxID=2675219 RepID=A0A6B8WNR3_9CORY|nr:glycosyltransferase [Corynebacterium occultum]QGU08008.1 Beta-monoglucosyldiacylglycerol synthase [Corynebacterium occultum]
MPLPVDAPEAAKREALIDAIDGLRLKDPEVSAAIAFTRSQKFFFLGLIAVMTLGMVLLQRWTLMLVAGIATAAYLITLIDRFLMFWRGIEKNAILRISDEQALAIPDDELPRYTVLVPAYGEPEVIGQLLDSMRAFDYPADKLQVLLLLEEDDAPTIEAAEAAHVNEVATILKVPAAEPRTKPKACNYGLHFATGEITTIFDAEDIPDPLQLRRVVAAFCSLDSSVACIQARLSYRNARQNLLTAWFTVEYDVWFNYLLPGIMRMDAPVPLGGTSNHLRTSVLQGLGAWDPYNVTEDADLGVRIKAFGYSTAVLDSVTWEEANSDTINWLRQRSRWYKGYLQTWLVYMRRPGWLIREIGPLPALRFTLLMAGTPIIAVVNMIFWYLSLTWLLGQPDTIAAMFPALVYYPALLCLIIGNAGTMYMNLVGVREGRDPLMVVAVLTFPLYWVLMSIAAIKGAWQLIFRPSYWEKTAHGLDA